MATYRTALGHRLAWAGFAAVCSTLALLGAGSDPGASGYIGALGWALLAVAWFLQPVLLTARLQNLARDSGRLGIGSPGLRAGLSAAGLGLIIASLLWRMVAAA